MRTILVATFLLGCIGAHADAVIVQGTTGNDTIAVGDYYVNTCHPFGTCFTNFGPMYYLNGTLYSLTFKNDDSLYVLGDDGHDTIEMVNNTDGPFFVTSAAELRPLASASVFFIIRLLGEGDNDTIVGSDVKDRLYGGDGTDTLYGRGGNDLAIGAGVCGAESVCCEQMSSTDVCVGDSGDDLVICDGSASGGSGSGDGCGSNGTMSTCEEDVCN